MDELEVPGENDAVWDFRVSVDFLVSARDMIEARSLVSRALNAEASDGTPFVTRDHRLIEDGRSWGVSDWQPVPPRPSQAALVQEKYPGLINDVAVVDGIGALLGPHAPAAGALPRQTLERIQQALADVDRQVMVEDPDSMLGRLVFEGRSSEAAAHLAEGVYRAFDADDREYALVVAPSELTPTGRVSAALPKDRHDAHTLNEVSDLLAQYTREQPLYELVRGISRRVGTTRRSGLPSWVPLEGEPERREPPTHVNVGVITWSWDDDEQTVLAHASPVTLARSIATMLYETMVDSDAFWGATEFLDTHTTPAEWRSPEDVDRWLTALREGTSLPSFSIQRVPVEAVAASGPAPATRPVSENAAATASEPEPVSSAALASYRVPVEFDVSARSQGEARRLVDEALEGDTPGGIAVVQQRQQVLADGDVYGVLGWHHPSRHDPSAADPVETVLAERAAQLSDDSRSGAPTPRRGWDATGRT